MNTKLSLHSSLGTGSEVEEDGMFEPVLRQGLKYQISVVENTVTTDAKGREGGDFDRNVIMTLSVQCKIWKASLIHSLMIHSLMFHSCRPDLED